MQKLMMQLQQKLAEKAAKLSQLHQNSSIQQPGQTISPPAVNNSTPAHLEYMYVV